MKKILQSDLFVGGRKKKNLWNILRCGEGSLWRNFSSAAVSIKWAIFRYSALVQIRWNGVDSITTFPCIHSGTMCKEPCIWGTHHSILLLDLPPLFMPTVEDSAAKQVCSHSMQFWKLCIDAFDYSLRPRLFSMWTKAIKRWSKWKVMDCIHLTCIQRRLTDVKRPDQLKPIDFSGCALNMTQWDAAQSPSIVKVNNPLKSVH